MANKPRLKVVDESSSGLNRKFQDTKTGEILTRGQVADRIHEYQDYHLMKVDGKRIIRSNPDSNENNNLN